MHYLRYAVIAISMSFPAASFVVPKGLGGSFYLLILCSLICIMFRVKPLGNSLVRTWREYWPLNMAMSGLFLATLANQLSLGRVGSNALEMPFLLACFPLLYWLMLQISYSNLKRLTWGLALGVVVCVISLHVESAGGTIRPIYVLDLPVIPVANIALLLGVLVTLSLGWNGDNKKFVFVLKIAVGIAALYASYLSQARGGWVGIPVFVLIALMVFRNLHLRHKFALVLGLAMGLCVIYVLSDTVQERMNVAVSDLGQFIDGRNKDTSLGQRLQLWQGAWQLFSGDPVLGIGRKHYPEAALELMRQQALTPLAASQPHTHNDVLFQMATLGIFGLIAIVALYFVPAWYFFREIHHSNLAIRTTAGMGLALTLGFFVFGLSDTMFFWRISYVFYVILLAMLFACLARQRHEVAQ